MSPYAAAGALTDFAFYDPREPRVSNLLVKLGEDAGAKQAVDKFLETGNEAALRQRLGSAGVDPEQADKMVQSARVMRAARTAREQAALTSPRGDAAEAGLLRDLQGLPVREAIERVQQDTHYSAWEKAQIIGALRRRENR